MGVGVASAGAAVVVAVVLGVVLVVVLAVAGRPALLRLRHGGRKQRIVA